MVGSGIAQLLLVGPAFRTAWPKMRGRDREADPAALSTGAACVDHGLHISNCVAQLGDGPAGFVTQQVVAELNQAARIRLIGCITHGDQRRCCQPETLLQHEAG